MLSLLALAIALVLTMVVFLRYMRRPEGAPPAVSVLDNLRWLRDFRRQPFELVTEFSAKYGPAFSVRMIGFRLNVVADREFAEQYFFKAKEHVLSFTGVLKRYFFHWFPPSFTYVGAQIPEWQTAERLRIVYQVFSPPRIPAFLPVVIEEAEQFLSILAKQRNVPDLHACIKEFINNVNLRVAVGNELTDPVLRARLLKEVTTLDSANSLSAIVCPALFLSKEVDQARYRLVDVVRGIADNKKRDNDSDCSLLAQLIKSETGLPFEDIYMGVIGTMLAAFINTAGTLTWAMAELLHPEYGTKWLEQVYAEQQQIIAEHGEGLSMAAINAMEVLNRIIMETGRKYSLFGHFRLVEQEERWRDYVFPKGEFVSYPIVIANLNPEIHPNPELFNPDRFLRPEAKSTFNLMQFGAGVHRCKGEFFALMVLKVMMALWVRKYKSHLLCPNFPGTDPTHVGGIYSPDAPLPFTVEPRA